MQNTANNLLKHRGLLWRGWGNLCLETYFRVPNIHQIYYYPTIHLMKGLILP